MPGKKNAFCPSCNEPAERVGKVIYCEECDASFRFTPEGPKVDKVGEIAKLKEQVKALSEQLEEIKKPNQDLDEQNSKPAIDPDEE